MELDELKKSWKALDDRLQKEPLTNEKQIEELIDRYKAGANRGLSKLLGVQRFSLWLGGGVALLCVAAGIAGCCCIEHPVVRQKLLGSLGFILASMLLAGGWDYKTFRWIKGTRVDELTVAEVSLRMVTLRKWLSREVVFVALWCVAYTLFNWWVVDGFELSPTRQIVYFVFCLILDAAIIGYFYKQKIYKHLNTVRTNIEELKDVCGT